MPYARFTLVLLLLLVALPSQAAKHDAASRYRYGLQLYEERRYLAAIRAFQRALASGGERVILYDLGRAQEAAGLVDDALATYQAFLRAAPMSPMRFAVRGHMRQLRTRQRAARNAALLAEKSKPPADASTGAPPRSATGAPPRSATGAQPRPATGAPARPALTAPDKSGSRIAMVDRPPGRNAHPVEGTATVPIVPPVPSLADGNAPADATPRRPLDALQLGAAGMVLGGAALSGGGIGCLVVSAARANTIDQSVRFDPAVETSGQRYQVAGAALSAVGVVAVLIGGELIRRHAAAAAERRAAAAAGRKPMARRVTPTPAGLELAF